MRRYRFTALLMLDAAACEDVAGCGLVGNGTRCLVEPTGYTFFPAVISTDEKRPAGTAAYALVTIALHDSEAGAYFSPGQRFTIWADALVGDTVQACGLAGYGVICQRVSLPARRAHHGKTARRRSRMADTPVPGTSHPTSA